MRFIKIFVHSILAVLLAFAVLSCSGNKEMDDLAKAQQCLDEVPQSEPTQADACLTYVEKYTSQQANILKCAIYMTSGGLVENKVVKAYEAIKDESVQENKTASFMAILALDQPNISQGYTKAVAADEFCQASGVPGLKYLSGIIVAGSGTRKVIEAVVGSIDITNPTAVNAAVEAMLDHCAVNPMPNDCKTDISTIGSAVVTLADSYCASENADDKVCTDVNSAVDAAGGVPDNVGKALFCYLDKKTYNSSTGECNP
ncbi:MAG: hypothetical protein AB7G93_19090 [Bdellovibrionales bacterium]